jgi:hypothetical protein
MERLRALDLIAHEAQRGSAIPLGGQDEIRHRACLVDRLIEIFQPSIFT